MHDALFQLLGDGLHGGAVQNGEILFMRKALTELLLHDVLPSMESLCIFAELAHGVGDELHVAKRDGVVDAHVRREEGAQNWLKQALSLRHGHTWWCSILVDSAANLVQVPLDASHGIEKVL